MCLVLFEGEPDQQLGLTQLCCCQLFHAVERPSFLMIQVDMYFLGTLLVASALNSILQSACGTGFVGAGGTKCAWIGPLKSPPSGVAPKQVIRTSSLATKSLLDL